jgi:hypothetical protein
MPSGESVFISRGSRSQRTSASAVMGVACPGSEKRTVSRSPTRYSTLVATNRPPELMSCVRPV